MFFPWFRYRNYIFDILDQIFLRDRPAIPLVGGNPHNFFGPSCLLVRSMAA